MTRYVALYSSIALMAPGVAAQTACPDPRDTQETTRLGSVSGDLTLSWLWDLDVGPDGRIYIAQDWLQHVTVLDPDGSVSTTIGRAGSGPGEFGASPKGLGWRGDTLWVSDRFQTQFFGPDGAYIRSAEFRTPQPSEISAFIPGTPLIDGSYLAERLLTGEPAPFFSAPRVPLLRLSETGEVVDTVTWVQQHLADFTIRSGEPGDIDYIHMKHPLAGWVGAAWLPVEPTTDGSGVIHIGRVQRQNGAASFELLVVGITGDTLLARDIPYEPRPVTRSQRDALRVATESLLTGELEVSRMRPVSKAKGERLRLALRQVLDFPDFHPPVREIVAGSDGSIWVLTEAWPSAADLWEVFNSGGARLGSVRIDSGRSNVVPWMPRLKLLWASSTEFWGMTLGDFDEPYLHHYEVTAACSPAGSGSPQSTRTRP